MLHCEITETMFYDEERRRNVTVYGLSFFPIGNKKIIVKTVDDIFCKKQEAVAAMERVNVDGISEVHIDDIIQNFLSEIHEYIPVETSECVPAV